MSETMTPKERTRARILDEAAKAMREKGADGIGVAALMKRAGLTHGGFYAHFENRDDLVAHAVDRMFGDSDAMVRRYLTGNEPARGMSLLIDYYLSEEARRRTDVGCPIPSLGGESSRMPEAARQRFAQGIAAFRAALAKALAGLGAPEPDVLAASVLAEMVGAMTLARTLDDETASIALRASREQLKRRIGLPTAL
ncbi:TetR/AcrR family transcriptional regulator [Novosphingobium sp. SG720]|uniref:TetR/AcrR family transcriptional regulator n=1 Tax=Novosphingobium sp. SG720 TaxID=2586998 RepID=UPI0014469502|nr:TetR/AcrR family transcriptional regulator [Novosphingobium sp. SG720]NKJ42282.1 TetR/AcrR family transcriptional repressor of nem operon [Novosphingobium sp. SG720]